MKYIGKKVKVLSSTKSNYIKEGVLGLCGYIVKIHNEQQIGVKLHNKYNTASSNGLYWFVAEELLIGCTTDEEYISDEEFMKQWTEELYFSVDSDKYLFPNG